MAYAGYLIQVGSYKIPHSWIRAETYTVTKIGQDSDSYGDANGKLHRNALEHWVAKVEFETPQLKTNTEVAYFMKNISLNYTNEIEKKANVTVYIPELDNYVTHEMYVPDIPFILYSANEKEVKYNQFRVATVFDEDDIPSVQTQEYMEKFSDNIDDNAVAYVISVAEMENGKFIS